MTEIGLPPRPRAGIGDDPLDGLNHPATDIHLLSGSPPNTAGGRSAQYSLRPWRSAGNEDGIGFPWRFVRRLLTRCWIEQGSASECSDAFCQKLQKLSFVVFVQRNHRANESQMAQCLRIIAVQAVARRIEFF